MSWAAELLTELCCAGSHLYLHPWHYIVKSRALRIFGGFLLLFFFFCIDFTMLCPTATEFISYGMVSYVTTASLPFGRGDSVHVWGFGQMGTLLRTRIKQLGVRTVCTWF